MEAPTDTDMGAILLFEAVARLVLRMVMPVRVRVVVAPIAHAPPFAATVNVRVFCAASIAPVMRAEPAMNASGTPAMGIFVKVMTRVPPEAMVPAVELNPMTKFWHVLLWHVGMETDVTWYPEMGPLGEPELTASMLV